MKFFEIDPANSVRNDYKIVNQLLAFIWVLQVMSKAIFCLRLTLKMKKESEKKYFKRQISNNTKCGFIIKKL